MKPNGSCIILVFDNGGSWKPNVIFTWHLATGTLIGSGNDGLQLKGFAMCSLVASHLPGPEVLQVSCAKPLRCCRRRLGFIGLLGFMNVSRRVQHGDSLKQDSYMRWALG